MPYLPIVDIAQPVNWASSLNRGLVSWWLNLPGGQWGRGTMFRDLCRKNDGTLTNGPTWKGALGRRGGFGSLSHDGSDDYENMGQSASLDLTAGDFTISFAYYANSFGTNAGKSIMSKRDAFGSMAWEMFYDSGVASSTGFQFWYGNGGANVINFGGLATSATGAWHYGAITRIGSAFTFYIDAVSVGTGSNATAIPASSDSVRIGVLGGDVVGNTLFHWDGFLDDIRVYPNRGLSAGEIASLTRASLSGYRNELNWVRRSPMVGGAAASGFKPAWASTRRYQVIGGGIT